MAAAPFGSILRQIQDLAAAPDVRQLADPKLLERFQEKNDQAAFAALVRRHGGMVWNVCRNVLGQEQDAEDAFQATFLVLADRSRAARKLDSVAGWLHGVARRTALCAKRELCRRRVREKKAELRTPSTVAWEVAWREVQVVLDKEIENLPDKLRQAFVLCCLEGNSQAEAARQLGVREGTVSSRLANAKRRLQVRLTRRGITLTAILGALAVTEGSTTAAPPMLVGATVQSVCSNALDLTAAGGAVTAPVAALAQGVLHTMFITRLVVTCAILFGICAAGAGVGILCRSTAAEPSVTDDSATLVAFTDDPAAKKEDDTAARQRSMNNLKMMALGMHGYHDTYGTFPPAAVYSMDGKPLLSWRVLLLPFLDQKELFKQFKLDEPWDSEHNKKLLEKIPEIYAPVRGKNHKPFTTYYQVFTGPGTIFDGQAGRRIPDITDGTSNTALIVEAAESVPWTKPADLEYAADKPVPRVGGLFTRGFNVAMADGSVTFLRKEWDEEQVKMVRNLIARADGNIVDLQKLRP